jgi:hypothetical protein
VGVGAFFFLKDTELGVRRELEAWRGQAVADRHACACVGAFLLKDNEFSVSRELEAWRGEVVSDRLRVCAKK